MKKQSAAPFIVSAMTLLATSLGVADASTRDGRKPDRQDDATVTASKVDRLSPRAAESRQIKGENLPAPRVESRQINGENLPDPRLQSRQIKGENLDRPRLESRQIKGENLPDPRSQSRQIKKGPVGDGG